MAQLNPLRPITQRLNSTPVEELTRYAGYLAASILNCTDYIRSAESQKSDSSVQIHKLITRVSSLLQDKTQEARFTGIVLVKALIEAVSSQQLAGSGLKWVASLLACLKRQQDAPQIKKLSIITITRIFMLTKTDQTMVREITTKSLPEFMSACLKVIKPVIASKDGVEMQILSPLLQPVLQCWLQLIKCFPSTIRPFVPSIRTISLSLLSSQDTPQEVKAITRQVFAVLHFCAPKDTAGTEWIQSFRAAIEAAHQTSDLIFRSIIEEWSAVQPRPATSAAGTRIKHELHMASADAVGMEKWTGLQAGCSRAVDVLELLEVMLGSQQAQAVVIPLTEILDLTARFTAVLCPSKAYTLRENKEITRDEREELYANLPRIHCAVMGIHQRIASTFGHVVASTSRQSLSQLWEVFESESFDERIRTSMYDTVKEILQQRSVLLLNTDSERISGLIRDCCNDTRLDNTAQQNSIVGAQVSNSVTSKADSNQRSKQRVAATKIQSALSSAAWRLLPVMLMQIPTSLLTSSARADLDRTAILIGHEEAMLASVMNPSIPRNGTRVTPNILPFLARLNSSDLNFEALMRPRMPIIRHLDQSMSTEEEEDQEEVLSEANATPSNGNLDAVSDHVAQQIQDNAMNEDSSDPEPLRKRDFATIDDGLATAPQDRSKRPKAGSPESEAETQPEATVEQASQMNVTTVEFTEVTSTKEMPQSSVSTLVSRQASGSPDPLANSEFGGSRAPPSFGQDNDSDDSEIPQIDTALSSDEDEDSD